jgi:hypothetical protein
MKQMSFISAMLDYFGKNGKDNLSFMNEIKALSPEDRVWFLTNLSTVGYEIVASLPRP